MPTQLVTSDSPPRDAGSIARTRKSEVSLLARIAALTRGSTAAKLLSALSFLIAAVATFALVAGLFGIVFILHLPPETAAIVFVSATVLGTGLITALSALGDLYSQRARDIGASAIYEAIAKTFPPKPYTLFLRPFASTGQIETDATAPAFPGTLVPLSENIELEHQIERAVRPSGQLIALGRSLEHVGAGRVTVPETNWRAAIRTLMDHAQLIIMLPSARPGTLEEIDMILSSPLVRKTVFLDPPNLEKSSAYSHADEWKQVQSAFDKHGLKLPPETRKGRILFFHCNAEPVLTEQLNIESELRVGRFFRRVRKHIRAAGKISKAQGRNTK